MWSTDILANQSHDVTNEVTSDFAANYSFASNWTTMSPNITGVVLPDMTYIYIVASAFYAAVFLFGVTGNILVIFVICRNPEMSTATNIFLVNMSAADLLVLLICMPTAYVEFMAKDIWLLGDAMCKIAPTLEIAVTNASILTMMALSFERYYAICRPLEVLYTCTKRRAVKLILCIWALSVTLALPLLFMAYTALSPYHDRTHVITCRTPVDTAMKATFVWSNFILFFLIPVFILALLYTRICRELMRESGHGIHGSAHARTSSDASPKQGVLAKLMNCRKSSSMEREPSVKNCPVTPKITANPSALESGKGDSGMGSGAGQSRNSIAETRMIITSSRGNGRPRNHSVATRCSSQYTRQRMRAMSLRRQIICMLIATIVFSFVCLLPLRVMALWIIYSSNEHKTSLGHEAYLALLASTRVIFYTNSAGNPLLYNMVSSKFRDACRECLLAMCAVGKKRPRRPKNRRSLVSRGSLFTYSLRSYSTKADVLDCDSQHIPMTNGHENGLFLPKRSVPAL